MGANQKPRRKLSVSDNTNTLKQVPSSASGSQGSTTTTTSSSGSGAKRQPSTSSEVPSSSGNGKQSKQQQQDAQQQQQQRPHVRQRHGRGYLEAPGVSYPLPIDLPEIHRQSLRTMLLTEVHGAPVRSPLTRPPKRVLEIGCGPGIWSLLCHRHFKSLGINNVSFTGVDIAPGETSMMTPDADMDWTYVQHDMLQAPWPFPDDHFDLVFHKEMTLAVPEPQHADFSAQSFRVLKPGCYLEIWEVDHLIRLLRPHTASEQDKEVMKLGAYVLKLNTPLSAPSNPFLVEYNHWLSLALEKRMIMPNPCTTVNHLLFSESELTDVHSHRLVIPFSEIRWEGQDGVPKVITKDGKAYVNTSKAGATAAESTTTRKQSAIAASEKTEKPSRVPLTDVGLAVRRTALLTLVQEIQAQELMLREVNGKGQDEWNSWIDKMTNDLMSEGGTSWGECLETGAWWAKKKEAKK